MSLTPHTLRHTCATHLLRGGASIRHVQELLAGIAALRRRRLARVAIEDLRQAIARAHPREPTRKRQERR